MENPLVSVVIITYNQAKFISQAIESVLMQRTNFPYRLIIGEDHSRDGTRDIVKKYANEHFDKITAILNDENLGPGKNSVKALKKCTGKYIAILDGDDYWTDSLKLQKQINFMEANPDYSLCFHDAILLWEDKRQPPRYFCSKDQKDTSTIEDVIEKWIIPTASMVYRRQCITPLPEWFEDVYNGDLAVQMLSADKGKIYFINEIMSVYRKNQGALSAGVGKDASDVNKRKIELLSTFNQHSHYAHNIFIERKIKDLEREIKIYNLMNNFPIIYYSKNPLKAFKKVIKYFLKFN